MDKLYNFVVNYVRLLTTCLLCLLVISCSNRLARTVGKCVEEPGRAFSSNPVSGETASAAEFALPDTTCIKYEYSSGCLFSGKGKRVLSVEVFNPSKAAMQVEMALVSDLSLMSETKDTVLLSSKSIRKSYAVAKFPLDALEPGFYQVNLTWKSGENSGSYDAFNIGIDPEKIVSPQDKRPDFDEFWEYTLAELSSIPMEISMELLPGHSDSLRNSYRVELTSLEGEKMGGYLCEPVKEGKYPVYIDYMGYGADPYFYDPSSEPEVIEFLVSVRNQGIFKDGSDKWIDRGIDSKENFYYRGAFCDVVRAVDFVSSLEKADTNCIFARGESQGGAFALVSAALDSRIDAIAPAVPFLNDFRDYSKIVWWPMWEVFQTAEDSGISRDRLFEMLSYFDVKNFADRISCPVYMAFGLQDPVCPPHTNFAGYNQIKSDKSFYCVPACGHAMWQETSWSERRSEWFKDIVENINHIFNY